MKRARWTAENGAAEAEAATHTRAGRKPVLPRGRNRIARGAGGHAQTKAREIESAEGKQTFEIQRAQMEAERVRDSDTQNNKTRYEDFNARLAQEAG